MNQDTRWMELSILCCVNLKFFAPFCFEITVKTSVFILNKKEWNNGGTKDIWFSSYYLRLYLLINLLFYLFAPSHRKKQKDQNLLYNNFSTKKKNSHRPDTIRLEYFKKVHKNLVPLNPFNGEFVVFLFISADPTKIDELW